MNYDKEKLSGCLFFVVMTLMLIGFIISQVHADKAHNNDSPKPGRVIQVEYAK